MATVNGMTAERMQTILNGTISDVEVSGDSIVLHKVDGSTETTSGDFGTYIDSKVAEAITAEDIPTEITTSVNTAVAAQNIPGKVAGGVTAKGNISGAWSFGSLTSGDLVNRIFTATLVGNITLNTSSLPASPVPGTQFAMVLKQDATGSRTLTTTGFLRSQGILALSTAANAVDIITCLYDGTNWYIGAMGVAFS